MVEGPGVAVGETVPDVAAPLVYPDGDVETVSLSELSDEKPVLVVFYTNDFSPDCVREWCAFRDFGWFATTGDVRVVGVSRSRVRTHRAFIDRLDLPFPLYSDRDLDVTEAFGVRYRVLGLVARPHRSVFLVDEDLTVQYRWLADHPVDPTRDAPDVSAIHEAVQDYLSD
ncbi:MAG: peroxiredoxin family protein [Halobacteriaceae archaeon]